jgi:excisionase family DNA binding protein
MNKLTIKEAAEALGCSVATIRRRIKSGDIKAELKEGPYGETYYISESDLAAATEIQEVIPVKRELDLNQIHSLFTGAMQMVVQPLEEKIDQQAELIKEQSRQIETLEKLINLSTNGDAELLQEIKNRLDKQEEQARERDKKLMETVRDIQKQKQKKWWKFWD